jgi:subtilase family serine protease
MYRPAAHGFRAPRACSATIANSSLPHTPLSLRLAALPPLLLLLPLAPLLLLLLLFLAAPLPAPAQTLTGLSAPPAVSQITGRIDENTLTQLPGNTYRLAKAAFDAGRVPDSIPQNHILMMLRRSPQREQALQQFMSDQYNPRSPNFHKWLTPEQFGELYGPSSADVDQVAGWLRQHGFVINQVPAGGSFIDFSGTAGQVEAAFHTEIHYYRVNGEEHFANASDPMIPAALAPVVSGFRALNNFHPKPLVQGLSVVRRDQATGKWTRLTGGNLTTGSGANASYLVGPSDFAQIYGVKQVWQQSLDTPSGPKNLVGTGQTIGVAGDTDLASGDIATFRDEFGISALGPNGSVFVDNPPASVCPAPAATFNDPEGYLDAEWSGAMAPDAAIDFVACGDEGVTSGADLASAYMVEDPAHAQKIGVLSTSYGYCEENPISESAQFYVTLWQQAAAEGMTVVVATGDAGAAECDEFTNLGYYAVAGFGVNAEASTPYNVAAGGTDFSDAFSGTTANYWLATNNANLESAISYIPEMTWNDSCASPLVLATFGQGFSGSAGANGFCTWASQQPIDPNTGYSPYFSLLAGSGGLSTVSTKPSWQAGVVGIPAGSARALPDISMFASSGYAWGHTLLLCDSALLPSGMTCDFSNPNNVYASSGGGTSFVAPAFAGIMALINQQSGRQGQANQVLYQLAGQQYVLSSSTTKPNLATCAAYLGSAALPSCYFHDISSTPNANVATQAQTPFLTGTNAVPCTGTATAPGTFTDTSTSPASNSENCYGYEIVVTENGGSLTTTPAYYGILSTADNAASPGYPAGLGYDLATGLGSPNVAAMVNTPAWSGLAFATSTTTLTSSSAAVGTGIIVTFTATVSGTGGTPSGTVTFYNGTTSLGTSTLANGAAVFTTSFSTAGTASIQAAYSGDAIFQESSSASLTETIVNEGFTASISPATLTIARGSSGTLTVTLASQGGFTGPVSFSCGTLPAGLSCSFAPPSITLPASGGAVTDTLTVNTAAATMASALSFGGAGNGILAAGVLWLPASAGLLGLRLRKRRNQPLTRIWMLGLLCILCAGAAAISGCGNSSAAAAKGSYSIAVNLTSAGGRSQTVNATVMVR